MYGPHQRWQGYGTDPGGFKRMMWYNIMKEYHCKAMSTRLSCDERKEMAFTHSEERTGGGRSRITYWGRRQTQVLHIFTMESR